MASGEGSRRLLVAALVASAALLGAVAPGAWGQSAADLYGSAQRAFEQGLLSPAADSLRSLLRQYPEDELADDSDYLLALCRVYSSGYTEAIRALEQFPRRYPGSPYLRSVSYWLGYARYSLGQLEGAVAAFRAQVDSYPEETRYRQYSLSYLAELYERSGKTDLAVDTCGSLLASGAGGEMAATALYRLGSIDLARKDYAAAQAAFARLRLEYPSSTRAADALFYEGEALSARGEPLEASRRYQGFVEAAAGRGGEARALLEQAYWRLARLASDGGDGEKVLAWVARLEGEFPSSALLPEALSMRAQALLDRLDYGSARAAYAAAFERLRAPADRQRIAFNMAACSLGLGEQAAALQSLEEAARGPDAAIARRSRYRQAALYAASGSSAKAIQILETLSSSGSADEETLRFYGGLLDQVHRPGDARAVWGELLSRFPSSPERPRYLYRRAADALELEEHAAALEDFNGLIREYGGKDERAELVSQARYNVGYVYSVRGEYVRSLPFFAAALQGTKDPELVARCLYAQGVAAYNTEDFPAASAAFARYAALAGDPVDRGRGSLGLGKAELRSEDWAGAAGSLRAAASLLDGTEEGAESLSWLGAALVRLGDADAAREAFVSLVTRYPTSSRAAEGYVRAGTAARASGDLAASREYLERALDRLPAGDRAGPREEALYELGLTNLALGRLADSRRAFADIWREFPASPLAAEGFLKAARSSYESGRFADAAREFLEVARSFPASEAAPAALFWAAESELEAGELERAAGRFWEYLKGYPESSYARAAEARVSDIVAQASDAGFLKKLYLAAEADAGVPAALANRVRLEYARALLARGSAREADEVARRIDEAELEEPQRGEAQLLAARLDRRLGRPDAALVLLEGLSTTRADRVGAEALLELGGALAESGKRQEAASELLRLTVLYPQHGDLVPRALYGAMVLLKQAGDADASARLSERLAKEYPEFKPPR